MEEVLEFAGLQSTRKTYKRILYRSEDAENIRTLNNKLIQAFHIFEVGAVYFGDFVTTPLIDMTLAAIDLNER